MSTVCGSTSADTQAGERFITEAEIVEIVRGLLALCQDRNSLNVLLRAIFVTVGWALFAFLVTRASSTTLDSIIYDPYEILGIAKVRGYVVRVCQ